MCGVCGVVGPVWSGEPHGDSPDGDAAREREVAAMLEALAHRGPDDQGLLTRGGATLGATRLAIRGLASGQQPMLERASGVVAVCNGEIDNHAELRAWLAARGRAPELQTDIAVIPGLYAELGDAFVERLVGAFAIAIWDPRTARLVLARDRAGERPLFFAVGSGVVRFATEIAALAADPAQPLTPDLGALHAFLRCGHFRSPASPFAEVRKVGPAELVAVDARGVSRRRAGNAPVVFGVGWRPPEQPRVDGRSVLLVPARREPRHGRSRPRTRQAAAATGGDRRLDTAGPK